MVKKIIYLAILLIGWSGSSYLQALSETSKFIVNHGVSACNGESPNCEDFIDRANQLTNERAFDEPSITFE